MIRAGLTGGLATGKSFVGKTLEELGCYWIQADALGHEVLEPGGPAHAAVIAEFGRGILNKDGTINRTRLADNVFGQPERLEVLNSLVHPHVLSIEEERIARFATGNPEGIVVVEAAILVETGGYKRFDRLIVTVCSEEQQIERALRREGATREQVEARLRRQMPIEDKVKLADYVVDTSGTKEETVVQVRKIHALLRRIAA